MVNENTHHQAADLVQAFLGEMGAQPEDYDNMDDYHLLVGRCTHFANFILRHIAEQPKPKESLAEVSRLILTPAEVRRALSIGRTTEHRWGKSGVLSPVYIGGVKRYHAEEIRKLMDQ